MKTGPSTGRKGVGNIEMVFSAEGFPGRKLIGGKGHNKGDAGISNAECLDAMHQHGLAPE